MEDDPPKFTREMAERARHMIADRLVIRAKDLGAPAREAIPIAEPPERPES